MAVVEDYPGTPISRENFADIQRAVGRLVEEEGFTSRLVDSNGPKWAAIMVYHNELTKDWLASTVSTLEAWEGSRIKIVGLDALPTYKRVAAWFLCPTEETERYFLWLRRLNQGMDTRHWRVYEHGEEPNGVCLVLNTDTASIEILERMRWRPFSGVGQATFSLLGTKLEGKK